MTTARTRVAVLLGHPVAHSLSPQIHTAAFRAAGVDAVYLACDVEAPDLGATVAGLRAMGFLGANLTAPHKTAVLEFVEGMTTEIETVGAANTLLWTRSRAPDSPSADGPVAGPERQLLLADNTDARALEAVARGLLGLQAGHQAVVVGAGGAARAAVVGLARLGVGVTVDARRPEAAAALAEVVRMAGGPEPTGAPPDIVVNATPLGWQGEPLPDRFMHLQPEQIALDLTYPRGGTPFLAAARAAGARAVDGLPMLVEQAALAFELWTGMPAPREAMTAAALGG